MLDTLTQLRPDWNAVLRVAIGVAILAAMVVGPTIYGTLTAGDRLDSRLANVDGPVNVTAALSFKPSAIHQQELSQYGVFGGSEDGKVRLFNVTPANLDSLSHLYWIDRIEPFQR